MSTQLTASEIMTVGRFYMMQKFPFFAYLLFNLEVIELDDDNNPWKLQTAAVDGKRFWYNPKFIQEIYQEGLKEGPNESKEIANQKVAFLCAHEVMHCALGHLGRRIDRDPKVWNQAADYAINNLLVKAGITMPKVGLYDEMYDGWSAEAIYDHLVENPDKTKGKSTLDAHAGDPSYPGQDGDGGSGDQDGEENGPGSQLSQEELDALKDEWEEAMVRAAQSVQAGDIPVGLDRLIRDITEPKVSWDEYINNVIQSLVRSDYSWRIPNKRTFANGITLPSLDYDDQIEIAVAIDMSGSISNEDASCFLGEIQSIMDQFSGFKIHIACFDTQIYNPATFTEESDLEDYVPKGGGGTDFNAWWDWAMAEDWYDNVGTVIFFTDGYPNSSWGPGVEKSPNTVWLVKGSDNEGPWGTTITYEKLDK